MVDKTPQLPTTPVTIEVKNKTYELFITQLDMSTPTSELKQALAHNRKQLLNIEQQLIKLYRQEHIDRKPLPPFVMDACIQNALMARRHIAMIIPLLNIKSELESFTALECINTEQWLDNVLQKAIKTAPKKEPELPPDNTKSLLMLAFLVMTFVIVFISFR